ncbi:hypothetical protein ACMHYB_03080 [Sorangium sp. So ce1128]
MAHALHEMPDMNTRFVADRAVPRRTVDVFFITAIEADRDLSGVKVERADCKSAVALAHELAGRARGLKEGRDPIFTRTKRTGNALPGPILRQLLRFSSWCGRLAHQPGAPAFPGLHGRSPGVRAPDATSGRRRGRACGSRERCAGARAIGRRHTRHMIIA